MVEKDYNIGIREVIIALSYTNNTGDRNKKIRLVKNLTLD